jgi:FKBP-type peptidyl-prolyl cis-trans isomerase SlyD
MSEVKNNVISVDYKLYKDTEKGEMIESTEGQQPLVFLSDKGQMIPEFEAKVVGLNVGDTFSFGIKADNAYGQRVDEAIIDLPQEMFKGEDGKLVEQIVVGNVLPLQNQDEQVHPGTILSIDEATIKFDMNHMLAGQDIYFTGSVLEVREATTEELEHGHVHGAGGVEH